MAIKAAWADHLEGTLPQAQGLKAALGNQEEKAEEEGADEFTVPSTLEAPPAQEPDQTPGSFSDVFPSFKFGDNVVVTNRFTIPVGIPGNPNFKKDINEGGAWQSVVQGHRRPLQVHGGVGRADSHSQREQGDDLENAHIDG